MIRALVAVVLLGVLTACASLAPAPTDPAPSSAGSNRPKTIDLTGVDPCALLTPAQRKDLGLDWAPYRSVEQSPFYETAVDQCTIQATEPAASLGITLVRTAGIERFADPALRIRTERVTAAGFPALTSRTIGADYYCDVIVDTGPGQLADLHYTTITRKPPIPQDDLCTTAVRAASAAMSTLASS